MTGCFWNDLGGRPEGCGDAKGCSGTVGLGIPWIQGKESIEWRREDCYLKDWRLTWSLEVDL
jgi:hypothetical protein